MESADNKFTGKFDWGLYPQAESFLLGHIETFLEENIFARKLSAQMESDTSSRFFDWIDHIILPENIAGRLCLEEVGFQRISDIETQDDMPVYVYPGAIFFPVLLSKNTVTEIALKPENIDHFIQTVGKNVSLEGGMYASCRKAVMSSQDGCILSAVERRGSNGFVVPDTVDDSEEYGRLLETFTRRQRHFKDASEGLHATLSMIEDACKIVPANRVVDAFFRAERAFWEQRNSAGRLQKARLDKLGLGWGNHDHHTYRSSREHFQSLMKIFEALGFEYREQFFAGEEAGWGAQVLEHPCCNIVLFADVDIAGEEKGVNFSRHKLERMDRMGTVGLWAALHGESMLEAGLHHLAGRFLFEKLRTDLKASGVSTMLPFSYFDFLKQAFTEGEMWRVDKHRLNSLLEKGFITMPQYEGFLKKGAVGSHMENIQRLQGFKGFNQRSVSVVIKATDPRKYGTRGS